MSMYGSDWEEKMLKLLDKGIPFENYKKLVKCLWTSMTDKERKKFMAKVLSEYMRLLFKEWHITTLQQFMDHKEEYLSLMHKAHIAPALVTNLMQRYKAWGKRHGYTPDTFAEYIGGVGARMVVDMEPAGWNVLNLYNDNVVVKNDFDDFLFTKFIEYAEGILANEKYREIMNVINSLISMRVGYGKQTKMVEKTPSCLVIWYNSAEGWYAGYYNLKKGEVIELDANHIIVPYPCNVVRKVQCFLKPLPLYVYSTEYKRRYIPPDEWEAVTKRYAKKQMERILYELSQMIAR